MGSLFALQRHPAVEAVVIHPTLYLDHGRCELVMNFLAGGSDWMLFIDDDTQFTMQAIDDLFAAADEHAAPICGGIYWSPVAGTKDPTNDVFPVIFEYQSGARESVFRDKFVYAPMPRGWVAAQTAPFPADAVGTGFLLIHRSVLVAMQAAHPGPLHWFEQTPIGGVACGEDLVFCYRARALGFPVTAVPLGRDDIYHIKTVKIRRPDINV